MFVELASLLSRSDTIKEDARLSMKPTKSNERQDIVLRLLQQRNEEGMRQLFQFYSGALMTIIQSVLPQKEVAEEVLHDVLLKVWNNIDRYDASKSRFFTWMARIARNAAIDKLRSKNYRKSNKTDEIDDIVGRRKEMSQTPSVEHIGVSSLLKNLDEDHRPIINLLYLQDYTQSEAAKELNVPLGTIKTRARRAISQLRTLLQNEMVWLTLLSLLSNLSF
ncbi:sigma-70 family RNA polymerase sigma factor [Neolewinella aurantiaca]|uniref:Sigma-70 family RNA polymerase sigma factor n=1 Tax=Neolewinella aurantiaca TaxID=2602767 RepID=A0A5C7FM98_9BACT|nr:sigma-70 family RNA polymerase sigma factor [Neolewinella aurantiaca]TXF91790.1 sigma-70 family RNA polymerase sigma factor [Neolewinella aurantiaca]